MPDNPSTESKPQEPAQERTPHPTSATSPPNALVLSAFKSLVVALVVGFVVWMVLEAALPVFHMPDELKDLSGNLSQAQIDRFSSSSREVKNKNAALAAAVLAAALAMSLTVAELLARRQISRAAWGAPLAAIVAAGGAIGAVMAGAVLIDALRLDNLLTKTLLVQGALLGIMGLGVGIAVSLPIVRPRLLANCSIGGLLGGILAALSFPMLVSLLPRVRTEGFVPDESSGRLLWILLASGLIGAAVAGLSKEQPKKAPAKVP